jgi:hypothetical protein
MNSFSNYGVCAQEVGLGHKEGLLSGAVTDIKHPIETIRVVCFIGRVCESREKNVIIQNKSKRIHAVVRLADSPALVRDGPAV